MHLYARTISKESKDERHTSCQLIMDIREKIKKGLTFTFLLAEFYPECKKKDYMVKS